MHRWQRGDEITAERLDEIRRAVEAKSRHAGCYDGTNFHGAYKQSYSKVVWVRLGEVVGVQDSSDYRNRAATVVFYDPATGEPTEALHVSTTLSRCTALLTATKTKTIADFDAGRVLKTLAGWRSRKSKPISVATSNHYLIAIKSFSRWLWQERKSPDDPLAGLRRLNAETDRKRIRRPLTPSELDTLLSVAHQSTRTFRGADWQFTGTDRSMLYAIAAFTGLRAGECSRLTKASFDFDAGTWTLPASATKNRKAVTLPLAPALANRLQPWLATLKRDVLFPGDWVADAKCFAGKFLKRDMKRAGIPYRDATGRVADFHSLRYTFITTLAKAGVHPAKAQRLARHSTVTLTMNSTLRWTWTICGKRFRPSVRIVTHHSRHGHRM
jgi:integrase